MKTSCYKSPPPGQGWDCREHKGTIHEYFDGSQELLWKKRKLTYGVMDKPQQQSPVADGKSVNAQMAKQWRDATRDTNPHRIIPGETGPSASPPTTGNALRRSKEKTGKPDISI
ncbi:hypothetical protein W01_02500 [Candidatus Nitrotoga sp. AM1P]|nr:hypothetical protein W01_02500 [Candidatus Nitrotoga sp. AM1P]